MILNQTFSKRGFDKYLDYVMMIVNGDFRKVSVELSDEIELDNFDYAITNHMREHKIYGLEDGVYKVIDQRKSSRYMYAHISNETIINVLFDDLQVENIGELLNLEKFKERVILSECFNFMISNPDKAKELNLKELDFESTLNLKELYEEVDWNETMDRWYDDDYLGAMSEGYCI